MTLLLSRVSRNNRNNDAWFVPCVTFCLRRKKDLGTCELKLRVLKIFRFQVENILGIAGETFLEQLDDACKSITHI